MMQRQKYKRFSEGIRSEYVHDEREKNVTEKITFQEKCKKIVYDNLEDIRRQEDAKDALQEKKFYKEMAKQEFAQKLLDKQEREKKVKMQKSLTDAWDGQVEYKRHKKMEMEKVKKQASYSLMVSERLHRTEDVEKKKQKKQKLSTQDETEQNMRDQMITWYEIYQSVGDLNEGFQSTSVFVQHESEMKLPEKFNSLEESKIVYDNLDNIKKKEAANFVPLEEKQYKDGAKWQLGQNLRGEQEREKKAILKKSLSDTLNAQIQYKHQKKKEMAEIERQQMAAIIESDRLHQIEEIEMRRQKKEKNQKFLRQHETEPNMEDRKKTVDDNLEDILSKEAAYDSLLQKRLCNNMAKEEAAKMLHEAHQLHVAFSKAFALEKKTPKQKPLADELAARYQYRQKQRREMDRTERQGVLPGYRAEEIGTRRQKKDPHQKLKTQDETKKHMDIPELKQSEIYRTVTDQRRDGQYESGFLDHESGCDIPDKDRSREIRKKIVYNQLSLIKKEEATKRAFMEDKLLKEMKHWEAAEQKREKLEREKKAAAIKSLTDSWDSQIQFKRQQKKELCEIERKYVHAFFN